MHFPSGPFTVVISAQGSEMLPGAAHFILYLLMLYLAGIKTEKQFFRVIKNENERKETQRQATCPRYLFFSLTALLQTIFCGALYIQPMISTYYWSQKIHASLLISSEMQESCHATQLTEVQRSSRKKNSHIRKIWKCLHKTCNMKQ